MQALTAPPRDHLTVGQVTHLLSGSSALQVDCGLDLLDFDLNVVRTDLALEDGTVERNMNATIHGSCSLRIGEELQWGTDLVRPWMTLSASGVTARFDCGVYSLSTPARTLGSSTVTYSVDGYDRLYLLDRPVGDTYSVPAGTSYLTAVRSAIAAAGLGGVALDGTAGDKTLPSAQVWSFLDDGGGTSTTWLRIVNDLLGAIGYRGLYADPGSGLFRSEPYQNPMGRAAEFTFAADGDMALVSDDRTETADLWGVPNQWVFVQTNRAPDAPAPVEGDGIYRVVNQSEGPTSVDARRLVWTSVLQVDAADQASLVSQGDVRVAADRRTARRFDFETAPFPAAGHHDVLLLDDPGMGEPVKVQALAWKLDLSGGDMKWTMEAVV